MSASAIQRFPKWLLQERRFEIYFCTIGPKANRGRFNVRLFSQYGRKCFDGSGWSIAEAAKNAKAKMGWTKQALSREALQNA